MPPDMASRQQLMIRDSAAHTDRSASTSIHSAKNRHKKSIRWLALKYGIWMFFSPFLQKTVQMKKIWFFQLINSLTSGGQSFHFLSFLLNFSFLIRFHRGEIMMGDVSRFSVGSKWIFYYQPKKIILWTCWVLLYI